MLATFFDRIACFFARRELRKPVDWNSCEWSPTKAGQRRLKEHLVAQYTEIIRMQIDHQQRMLMQEGELLRLNDKASADRARAEIAKQYEIHLRLCAAATEHPATSPTPPSPAPSP